MSEKNDIQLIMPKRSPAMETWRFQMGVVAIHRPSLIIQDIIVNDDLSAIEHFFKEGQLKKMRSLFLAYILKKKPRETE